MKVAIIGGGVAGVSTAIALKQRGFDVAVFERHLTENSIGAGIVVWPNAVHVLHKLQVLDKIKAISGYPKRMQRLSSNGGQIGSINIELINGIMGYPSLSVLRSEFQEILCAKLAEFGVEVNYGYEATCLQSVAGKTSIDFQNGESVLADIVIGADGRMSSQVRKYVLGDARPVYQGFINWIGICESHMGIFQKELIHDYWGVGKRFGIVPISEYKAYWAGGLASAAIGASDPACYKEELTTAFFDWAWSVKQVIDKTPTNRINKIYVHDHDPVDVWHRRNVVIIGDAAHAPLPTSGQGACQALEDAWCLANCLVENSSDLDRAFTQFTQQRLEKTTKVTNAGRYLASTIFNTDPEFCEQRNEAGKTVDYLAVARGMADLWGSNLSYR